MTSGAVLARAHRVSGIAAFAPLAVWLVVLLIGALVQAFVVGRVTAAMIGGLAIATMLQMGGSLGCVELLRRGGRAATAALLVTVPITLVAPLAIPSDGRPLRAVAACASVISVAKLWDLYTHVRVGAGVDRNQLLRFLFNPLSVVLRKEAEEARPSRERVRRDLVRSVVGTVAAVAALWAFRYVEWREVPLLVEHIAKAVGMFMAVLYALSLTIAVVRLAGGVMRDFSEGPLLARTPADFWRRYNRVLNQYFHENVFKRMGGRRSPAAVTIFIFVLSAVVHEYVFGIAIGRVQGYQTAFFLLQGIAVAATLRVRPKSRAAVVAGVTGTLAFNAITSFLFFLSFHAVFGVYSNAIPAWLAR